MRLLVGAGAAAALVIPATVFAAGNGAGHAHGATTQKGAMAQNGNTARNGNGAGDRDVPGAANDPSAPRHDHDNGIGNDCDPGLGGSNHDTGNDGRYGEGDSTCQHSSGRVSGSHNEKPGQNETPGNKQQSPPTVTQQQSGAVEAASAIESGGHGGGGASGGVAAAAGSAAARGVALAQTGARLPIFGGAGILLLACGALLMRRRRLRAQEA